MFYCITWFLVCSPAAGIKPAHSDTFGRSDCTCQLESKAEKNELFLIIALLHYHRKLMERLAVENDDRGNDWSRFQRLLPFPWAKKQKIWLIAVEQEAEAWAVNVIALHLPREWAFRIPYYNLYCLSSNQLELISHSTSDVVFTLKFWPISTRCLQWEPVAAALSAGNKTFDFVGMGTLGCRPIVHSCSSQKDIQFNCFLIFLTPNLAFHHYFHHSTVEVGKGWPILWLKLMMLQLLHCHQHLVIYFILWNVPNYSYFKLSISLFLTLSSSSTTTAPSLPLWRLFRT